MSCPVWTVERRRADDRAGPGRLSDVAEAEQALAGWRRRRRPAARGACGPVVSCPNSILALDASNRYLVCSVASAVVRRKIALLSVICLLQSMSECF
jgi:hypothetical protein